MTLSLDLPPTGEKAFDAAMGLIERTLPADHFGWAKALSERVPEVAYSENSESAAIAFIIKTGKPGKPPSSFDGFSGAIIAQDIFQTYGIHTTLAKGGLSQSNFLMDTDFGLLLPDRSLIRLSPLFEYRKPQRLFHGFKPYRARENHVHQVQNGLASVLLGETAIMPLAWVLNADGHPSYLGMGFNTARASSIELTLVHLEGGNMPLLDYTLNIFQIPKEKRLTATTSMKTLVEKGVRVSPRESGKIISLSFRKKPIREFFNIHNEDQPPDLDTLFLGAPNIEAAICNAIVGASRAIAKDENHFMDRRMPNLLLSGF